MYPVLRRLASSLKARWRKRLQNAERLGCPRGDGAGLSRARDHEVEDGQRGRRDHAELHAALRDADGERGLEHLLGQRGDGQGHLPPGERAAPRRRAAHQPLPEPLRAHAQGPHGEEHQALPPRRVARRDGRPAAGLRPRDVHAPRGLQPLRRGVPALPQRHVDHEARQRRPGPRHLHHQQALADQALEQRPLGEHAAQGGLRDLALHRGPHAHRRQEVRPAALRARDVLPAPPRPPRRGTNAQARSDRCG